MDHVREVRHYSHLSGRSGPHPGRQAVDAPACSGGALWSANPSGDARAADLPAGEGTRHGKLGPALSASDVDIKLVAHGETREGAIYALMAIRSGVRGPNLRPPAVNCAAIDPKNPPPGVGMCGGIRRTPGRFEAKSATMAQLATALSIIVQRPVVDRTSITGPLDFDMEWKPIDPNVNVTDAASVIDFAPSLLAALDEQLGLKLEAQRGSVDYIVIDSMKRPTPD